MSVAVRALVSTATAAAAVVAATAATAAVLAGAGVVTVPTSPAAFDCRASSPARVHIGRVFVRLDGVVLMLTRDAAFGAAALEERLVDRRAACAGLAERCSPQERAQQARRAWILLSSDDGVAEEAVDGVAAVAHAAGYDVGWAPVVHVDDDAPYLVRNGVFGDYLDADFARLVKQERALEGELKLQDALAGLYRSESLLADAPSITGALPRTIVDEAVRRGLPLFERCRAKAVHKRGAVTLRGTVALRFVVDATGQTRDAQVIESFVHDAGVERCLERAAEWLVFPAAHTGGVSTVVQPLTWTE